MWARRCTCCESLDLDAVFGAPEMADHAPWCCPHCGARAYVLDRLAI